LKTLIYSPENQGQITYTVLGIARGASREEVRSQYKEQMKLYHPDRVAHLGAELQTLALEKSKEIQRAYATLKV
jgi:DnaJ-class molecular chaperone